MSAAAVAVLVSAAIALLAPPRRRAGMRDSGPRDPPRRVAWRPRRLARAKRRKLDVDLGVLVMEVATRLRAGAPVDQAWRETFARAGVTAAETRSEDGVPPELLTLMSSPQARHRLRGQARHVGDTTAGALPGTLAACRLTRELGAPLADVLHRCADGLTEAGHARAARSVALAGPRATARLLGWLPALGILLALAVGADPVDVLLDGGLGTVCLVVGLALMIAGRRWVAALERRAAGRPPGHESRRGGVP